MKKLMILAAGFVLLVPSLAFSDSFTLRGGYFMPRAVSNSYLAQDLNGLWGIEFDQMAFRLKDFRGSTLGVSYEYFLGKNVSLVLSLDSFSKRRLSYYYDWVQFSLDEGDFAFPYEFYDGDEVIHQFRVSSTPLQASFKFAPLGRKTRLIPYVGGGVGLYFWSAGIYGEMVDFSEPWVYPDEELGDVDIYPVIDVNGREKGTAIGYHAFAGLQVPIGYRATIDAEARYHWAKGKFDDGWFTDFDDFELGGLAVTLGFSYWF